MKEYNLWKKKLKLKLGEDTREEEDDSSLEPSPYSWGLDLELLVVGMVKSKEKLPEVKEEENKY